MAEKLNTNRYLSLLLIRNIERSPYTTKPIQVIYKPRKKVFKLPFKKEKERSSSTKHPNRRVKSKVSSFPEHKTAFSYLGEESLLAWKEEHEIPLNSKVFIIIGNYPALKKALIDRNWTENPDENSIYFNLKWTTKARFPPGIQYWQKFNHFERNIGLCTKDGLASNLSRLESVCGVNSLRFYPRCFLASKSIPDEFYEAFKSMKAVSILKKYNKDPECCLIEKAYIALIVCYRLIKHKKLLANNEKQLILVTSVEWKLLESVNEIEISHYYQKLIGKSSYICTNLEKAVRKALKELRKLDPQFGINGEENWWIVKPGRKSRGRGIAIYKKIEDIKSHINNSSNWVIQKYIERPLLIMGKKFDIRQWVVITQAEPLTVYIYKQAYIRFTVENFNLENEDLYAHLTNNSISKHSENFNSAQIEGCMWKIDKFQEYLKEEYGKDVWKTRLYRKMKKIIKWSVISAGSLSLRKSNSFELYGYDFMVDEELKPWLLEINSSPSMEVSTSVTAELVQNVLEDIVKLVIDREVDTEADIGNFELCYRAKNRLF